MIIDSVILLCFLHKCSLNYWTSGYLTRYSVQLLEIQITFEVRFHVYQIKIQVGWTIKIWVWCQHVPSSIVFPEEHLELQKCQMSKAVVFICFHSEKLLFSISVPIILSLSRLSMFLRRRECRISPLSYIVIPSVFLIVYILSQATTQCFFTFFISFVSNF